MGEIFSGNTCSNLKLETTSLSLEILQRFNQTTLIQTNTTRWHKPTQCQKLETSFGAREYIYSRIKDISNSECGFSFVSLLQTTNDSVNKQVVKLMKLLTISSCYYESACISLSSDYFTSLQSQLPFDPTKHI